MNRCTSFLLHFLTALLLISPGAAAQINWSLSANFVSAAEAGGPNFGLANPVVRDIQEDGKGRMWFATQTGVSCYDGKTFKSYLNTPADSLLWKDWGCHFLTADGTGRIWLATTFKLFYFEEKKDRFVEYDLSGVEPEAKKDHWQSEIYLLDLLDEGAVWFRKSAGLYAIDARSMKLRKKMTIPLAWRSVSGLLGKDNDGLFWAGGWRPKDLALFQSDGTIRRKINVPFDVIRDMFQQPGENIVWLGTTALASYDKSTGQWEQWLSASGYYEGFAMAPKLTSEPILWMYPIGKAIVYGFNLKEKKIAYQTTTNNLPSNPLRCSSVECLFVDAKSNIWIGGKEGVSVVFCNHQEKDKWGTLAVEYGKNARIKSNPLIIGTWDMPDGSIAEWINDGQDYFYVALSKHSKAYFEGTLIDNSTIAGKRTFIDTETGTRLVSDITYFRNEKGQWKEIIKESSDSLNLVKHMAYKSNVVVCRGKGFNPTTDISGTWDVLIGFYSYYFQDGDFLSVISPDHLLKMRKSGKNTWKGRQIRTYGGCRTEMEVNLSFVRSDSIYAEWTALDSHCDLEKGIKGAGGLKRFKAISDNDSVFISEFRIFDEFQPVIPTNHVAKELVINHDQNFISFDFSSSSDPATTTFYYQLEGFDKSWFMARMQHSATYTNLDGGSYIFKVRATDAEGNELRGNAQFMLRVRQPFYKTWWFISLAAVLFFGLIWFIFQVRLRQRLEKEDIRRRIARDLHDEVGSTLTTISILSESVLRQMDLDGEKTRLGGIGEKARTAMSSMSDIVWSVNPQNDNMDKIVERMIRFAAETLEPLGISAIFDIEKEVYALQLPMEQRKDFYLFFKEATTNVAKHSGANRAVFSLKKTGRQLCFTLEDDGKGLPTQPQGSLGGNGWHNMRARAAALGAQLEIKTGENRGVLVSLRMPTA
jgi:signal transduction histidine kinase